MPHATGGNPLFLQELLRALEAARSRALERCRGDVHTVGPAAVSRFVLHRLARLGRSASELARAVAVLGDDSELRLAARRRGPQRRCRPRCGRDDLVRADIFARDDRLGFVHPIVRAALYEDLAPGESASRHAAVAEALARMGAPPERVTAHLLLTPRPAIRAGSRRCDLRRRARRTAAHRARPPSGCVERSPNLRPSRSERRS